MLDAFIIEHLKRERDRRHEEEWQPIPLPLEEYPEQKRDGYPEKKREQDNSVIVFRF